MLVSKEHVTLKKEGKAALPLPKQSHNQVLPTCFHNAAHLEKLLI